MADGLSRLIVIPLSFLRRLDSLKYTSIAALVSMAYLVVLVVYHFAAGDTVRGEIHVLQWSGFVPTLRSFPVIVFAFTCHQNVLIYLPSFDCSPGADNVVLQMFSVLNEISNNSHFHTTSVVLASIGSSAATYILVAVTGYLSFGDKVSGNIVQMYPPGLYPTIGRAAIVMLVMFSYPLQCHPCRASVDAVLKWRGNSSSRNSNNGNETSPNRTPLLGPRGQNRTAEPISELRFSIITTTILVLSYIVAMTVSSLSAVLAYVGSTGSTSISFILPGLFYYKISSPDSPLQQLLAKSDDELETSDDEENDRQSSIEPNGNDGGDRAPLSDSGIQHLPSRQWRKILLRKLSLALAVYGIVVMVLCVFTNTFFSSAH